MLKEKRKKFLYPDVNWKVLSTAKCILKINPKICEILGGRSALPPPLKSPMITQQPTQKAGPVLKPLRCSQNQCWADGIRITGVFTKSKSVGYTTGDSESVGLRKESREGGREGRRKSTNNCDKRQVQFLVMIYGPSLWDFLLQSLLWKFICLHIRLCRNARSLLNVTSMPIWGSGEVKVRGDMIIILLHRKQSTVFPQVSYHYESSGFIFKT